MGGSEAEESLPTVAGECEAHAGLAILVAAGLGIAQVLAAHRGYAGYETPGFRSITAGSATPLHQDRIRRHNPALILQRRLLAGIGSAHFLLDLEHGGGLHDVLDPRRVVYVGQLYQYLVLPQA